MQMRAMDVSDRCVSTRSLCELPACCPTPPKKPAARWNGRAGVGSAPAERQRRTNKHDGKEEVRAEQTALRFNWCHRSRSNCSLCALV
jgi:hypothetical protein